MHGAVLQPIIISIHAPREGSDYQHQDPPAGPDRISIHAPREGSDVLSSEWIQEGKDFYPRSPRGERLSRLMMLATAARFLSTLPARGATFAVGCVKFRHCDFYPRSPRGERPLCAAHCTQSFPFLSTLPARGATTAHPQARRVQGISIHAPREGSDGNFDGCAFAYCDFYPRSPRGERPSAAA